MQVIDADNSCLFNAVGYVMESGNRRSADRLRCDALSAARAFKHRASVSSSYSAGASCKWSHPAMKSHFVS